MKSYFLKRFLSLVPVCILLIVLAFILTLAIPGDAVDAMLMREEGISSTSQDYKYRKEKLAEKLGLNKPVFYFSISSLAEINTHDYFANPNEKFAFDKLLNANGNYLYVKKYFSSLNAYTKLLNQLSKNKTEFIRIGEIRMATGNRIALNLKTESNQKNISENILLLENLFFETKGLHDATTLLKNSFAEMQRHSSKWKTLVPAITINTNNQFHNWFFGNQNSKGIIRGDFGNSYFTGKPVLKIIKEKIIWSLIFSAGSILLAYLFCVPLSVFLIYKKSKVLNFMTETVISFCYATPVYLMGVILIYFFSNPDMLNIFPSSGVKPIGGFNHSTSSIQKLIITLPYLVLPIICYSYGTFSFLFRTTHSLLNQQMKSDYVRTARAKGVREFLVILNHALRNSLLPLIAVFSNLFPILLGGSVILESIFSIPGMGFEAYTAVLNRNYPVIIAVFAFSGLLTVVGYLITDLVYAKLDPRIAFSKN